MGNVYIKTGWMKKAGVHPIGKKVRPKSYYYLRVMNTKRLRICLNFTREINCSLL